MTITLRSKPLTVTSAPNPVAPRHDEDHTQLFVEKGCIDRSGRIRELVFGSLDGLLVPLGVISGVVGGTGSRRAVLTPSP